MARLLWWTQFLWLQNSGSNASDGSKLPVPSHESTAGNLGKQPACLQALLLLDQKGFERGTPQGVPQIERHVQATIELSKSLLSAVAY